MSSAYSSGMMIPMSSRSSWNPLERASFGTLMMSPVSSSGTFAAPRGTSSPKPSKISRSGSTAVAAETLPNDHVASVALASGATVNRTPSRFS